MDEKFLEGNYFVCCTRSELLSLWDALKQYYKTGELKEGNLLRPYRQMYKARYLYPMQTVEKHLLIAIANEFCGG